MQLDDLLEVVEVEREAQSRIKHTINVCVAAGCLSCQSDRVLQSLRDSVKSHGLEEEVAVKEVGCMGLCSAGPLVSCSHPDTLYQRVSEEHAEPMVASLGSGGVKELACSTDAPFFSRQVRIVLENSGVIDPGRIQDYIAVGGYKTLAECLVNRSAGEIVNEVIKSGLRGRGGGGYPTGLKWSTVSKAHGETKYVICNADEGDPGAFMDRSVLESDPHRVLEGMALAAYAVGASRGYIYIRAEYPLAIKRLQAAIRQAEKEGLLGNEICESPFSFHVEIRLGAGAFVCGEETALIASIQGRRGAPRPRPPYPAEQGVWGCPTLINNVETFANVPAILRNGGDWYASIGTEGSKGTKVFALAGSVKNTGLIEVPMGTSLRDIVFEIGGGITDGRRFKAIQTGGPSGGCIPEEFLDMPVDYESLREVGSIMGSGGMIVMDETADMVDVAKYFMEFSRTESCGKCVPCRVGTIQMHNLLTKLAAGKGSDLDLARLKDLGDVVKNTSLCGLGQSAPNPIFSTLRFFPQEYESKITATLESGIAPGSEE